MNFRHGLYLFALGLFAWIFTASGFVYAGDSDLDPAFGTSGVATVNYGANSWGENYPELGDIALQSDGKIVQVGSYLPYYGSDFALARYTSTGVLDTSFDGDGKIITDLFSTPTTKYSDDHATSVVIQSDGKIIAAGSSRTDVNGITTPNFNEGTSWMWWNAALTRYNTNGSLDTDFGTGGKVEIDVGNAGTADAIYEIALQTTDGKIVAVGYTMSGLNNRFLVMRFNANGTLDTTFNTTGYRIEHFAENTLESATALAIQPDGNIVVTGTGVRPDGKSTISTLRLTSAGLPDSTFSGDGKLVHLVGEGSGGNNVVIDANSKILVGGNTRDTVSGNTIFVLVRYNPDGSLDTTFDTDGIVSTSFAGTTSSSMRGLALQADSKIVAYGVADVGSSDLVLARYNPDGSLDATFDSGDGMVRTDLNQYDIAANIVLQADGKILASAIKTSSDLSYKMLAVLRYGAETVDLTMVVNPAGAGTTTPSAGTSGVLPSTPQAISATANPSYSFVNWTTSGAEAVVAAPDSASTTVSLTGNATVTANFCLVQTWYRDFDLDTYGDVATTMPQCSQPPGYVANNTDCNDTNNAIYLGAVEIAGDGIDQDCNGADTIICIVDGDKDGYGTSLGTTTLAVDGTCDTAQGESVTSNDCNDTNSSINPGAAEIVGDGIDQDCNGADTIICIVDGDKDGYGTSLGTTTLAVDGTCDTAQGESVTSNDCNDTNSAINPGAVEICDGIDNDCDNNIDESVTITWYKDNDGDTYGDPGTTTEACSKPTGYVSDNTDCNDTDIKEHPGQTWYKDKDGDGYSDGTTLISCERPADYYIASELIKISGDPDDNDPNIIPKTFPWTMFLPAIIKQKL